MDCDGSDGLRNWFFSAVDPVKAPPLHVAGLLTISVDAALWSSIVRS